MDDRTQDVVDFFIINQERLLELVLIAETSKFSDINALDGRMLAPYFLHQTVAKVYDKQEIEIKEHDGKSYDWIVLGHSKVSVKNMRVEVMPRRKKYGVGKTKPPSVSVKNTRGNRSALLPEDFDYLLVTVATKNKCAMYLLSYEQVERLTQKVRRGKRNGYDGNGQIKIFLDGEQSCLACLEMDDDVFQRLNANFQNNITDKQRSEHWRKSVRSAIDYQIALTVGN